MVAALKLISHKLCPYVQRAVIALTEKGVAFERIDIDLANKPDWFLKISPLGKTPVLQVGDIAIFESAVILEYLEETQPRPLHPAQRADPRRASRLDRIRIGRSQRYRGLLRRQGRSHVQGQDGAARTEVCAAGSARRRRRRGSTARNFRWSMRCSVRCFAISMCSTAIADFGILAGQAEARALAQKSGAAAVGAIGGECGLSGAAARFHRAAEFVAIGIAGPRGSVNALQFRGHLRERGDRVHVARGAGLCGGDDQLRLSHAVAVVDVDLAPAECRSARPCGR